MKKHFFILILPVIWAVVSLVSYYHPGDEYGIYAYSNIIGIWPFFFLPQLVKIQSVFFALAVAAIGTITIALICWGLDKLQTNRWCFFVLWLIFSIIIFVLSVMPYPTIAKALAKNGSWMAYIAGSINIALYPTIIFTVIGAVIMLIIKKYKVV